MRKYLGIYRPLNLIFIACAQWLCAYFLDIYAGFESILELGIYWIMLGTAATAAFGYWVNDLYDKQRDEVNKPHKMAVHHLSKWMIIMHLVLFILLIVLAGLKLSPFFLGIFLSAASLLWLYSLLLKDTPGVGNLVIALLSFISIYMLRWRFEEIDPLLLIHFALLAGLLNFCREVVKDAEDMKGDALVQARTIPIVFGLDFANRLVYFVLLFVISFVAISLFYQRQYFKAPLNYVYWSYYLLFVIVPLYKLAMDIRYGEKLDQYSRYSTMLKYVLYTGIISILFF